MASVTMSARTGDHPQVRALNVLRDLPGVADLIELCFSSSMDNDGQRYVNDMRRAGRNDAFTRWANHMADSASLPLTGYVWEENNRIVGNASLIPFRDKGKRIYLIANVATHPDFRNRGIARILTRRAIDHARRKNAPNIWLHVRDDNLSAIKMYKELGFQEVARRTMWFVEADLPSLPPDPSIQIVPRQPRFWVQQRDWLKRLYPDTLHWYSPLNLNALQPGFWNWVYTLFMDFDLKHWAILRGGDLLAVASWMSHGGRSEPLYVAMGERADSEALTRLLGHVRRSLPRHYMSVEYPAGEMVDAIRAAGFEPRRTLIWMKA